MIPILVERPVPIFLFTYGTIGIENSKPQAIKNKAKPKPFSEYLVAMQKRVDEACKDQ